MSHYGLNRFIMELEHLVPHYSEQKELVNALVHSMQKLLSNPQVLDKDFVDALIAGHIDGRVYTSPEHGFYIQIFAWPPHVETPIHDHNTWGLMGILSNQLQITEYKAGSARADGTYPLQQGPQYIARQGSISGLTCPDDEVHHIKNNSDQYSLSIHVYGSELDHTHTFDFKTGQMSNA